MVLHTAMWGDKPPTHEDLYRQLQPGDTKFFEAIEKARVEKETRNRRHAASIADRLKKVKPPENTGKKFRRK